MKATVAAFMFALIVSAVPPRAETPAPRVPQERPRLDAAKASTPAVAQESTSTATSVVPLQPYVVHDHADSSGSSPLIPIPQGAPAAASSTPAQMLQSGVLWKHEGKKSKVQFGIHGDSGAGGFGNVKIGCSVLW